MLSRLKKSPAPTNKSSDNAKTSAQVEQQALPDNPNEILYLQRTIGNRAVTQLLKSQRTAITPDGSATLSLKIQRQIMSYKDFLEASGQQTEQKLQGVFNGKAGKAELDASRKGINPNAAAFEDAFADKTNINHAYSDASANESVETLTNLYDTIMYWQTMYGGLQMAKDQKPFLDGTRNAINIQVKKLIRKENAKNKPKTSFMGKGKEALKNAKDSLVSGRKDDEFSYADNFVQIPPMPAYMSEVGIPFEYYETNFVDSMTGKLIDERVFFLEKLLTLLRESAKYDGRNLGPVDEGFKILEESGVESVYLLKSVVYAHFGIVLDNIVGTDRDASVGTALTPAEIEAIITYSGGAYTKINAAARSAAPENKFRQNSKRNSGGAAASGNPFADIMQLAVSGLNKLPRYQGIAYRGLAKPPDSFASYAYEGAVVGDLGFSSASPALTAVYTFLESKLAPGNVIYKLQSKSAANIISLSANVQEGEVLFRPGARFQITKIWKHDVHGNVPEDAPADIQMILAKRGALLGPTGRAFNPAKEKKSHQMQVIEVTEV